jgi:endonuclease III
MNTNLTKKDKEFVRKCAPTLARELFAEEVEKNSDFVYEMDIRNSIRNAGFNGIKYIGLKRIARAVKDGIGSDLPQLIKELQGFIIK